MSIDDFELENYDRGYTLPPEKFACADHFDDIGIKEFINGHEAKVYNQCNYCEPDEQSSNAMSLELLIEHISESINHFYGDPDNEGVGVDSGEYVVLDGEIFDTYDLFYDHEYFETHPFEIFEEIYSCFEFKNWCIKDPYGSTEAQELGYSWQSFVDHIKHKKRFFNLTDGQDSDKFEILNDIGQLAIDLKLIREMPKEYVYRVRQHKLEDNVSKFEEIGSPPVDRAKASRMSPAGISMFYSSFSIEGAIKETVEIHSTDEKFVSIGKFSCERINVLDLSLLDTLAPTIFSKKYRERYSAIMFLKNFYKEVCKSIKRDDKIHIEYLPTQFISEYFRYIFPKQFTKELKGIIHKSSMSNSNVCVLFADDIQLKEMVTLEKINKLNLTDVIVKYKLVKENGLIPSRIWNYFINKIRWMNAKIFS